MVLLEFSKRIFARVSQSLLALFRQPIVRDRHPKLKHEENGRADMHFLEPSHFVLLKLSQLQWGSNFKG